MICGLPTIRRSPRPSRVRLRSSVFLSRTRKARAHVRSGPPPNGGLHGALEELQSSLRELGGELVIMRGASARNLERVAIETGASSIFWNRRYDGASRAIDRKIKLDLTARGIAVESFSALLLHEPWTIKTASGEPFRVFTPFGVPQDRPGSQARRCRRQTASNIIRFPNLSRASPRRWRASRSSPVRPIGPEA